jgi:hypothetical protein
VVACPADDGHLGRPAAPRCLHPGIWRLIGCYFGTRLHTAIIVEIDVRVELDEVGSG